MSQISGNLKNCWSRCPPSSSPLCQSHSIQYLGCNYSEIIALFTIPLHKCIFFALLPFSLSAMFFLNHWNNLIKTAKKPDVSVVKTSSVPVSHGGGLINMKCLFFKTFQFCIQFSFQNPPERFKDFVTFQHHNVPIKAGTHQIHSVTKLLIPTFSSKTFFSM